MKNWKNTALFGLGGSGYVGLEFLWRGYSHISMFAAGGICFLILGKIEKLRLSWPVRTALGAAAITAVELGMGLLTNRNYQVWDYRGLPGNFLGQICPRYTILWLPVAWAGMMLYRVAERRLNPPS